MSWKFTYLAIACLCPWQYRTNPIVKNDVFLQKFCENLHIWRLQVFVILCMSRNISTLEGQEFVPAPNILALTVKKMWPWQLSQNPIVENVVFLTENLKNTYVAIDVIIFCICLHVPPISTFGTKYFCTHRQKLVTMTIVPKRCGAPSQGGLEVMLKMVGTPMFGSSSAGAWLG